MSATALRHVAMTTAPIPPTARLVLFELANCHNDRTGECFPSIHYLAARTGLALHNVRTALGQLVEHRLVEAASPGWRFPGMTEDGEEPLPPDWQPSEATIDRLCRAFPNHDFNPQEAIDEFARYAAARKLRCHPARRDAVFFANLSAYLRKHRSGPVTFRGGTGREGAPSLRAFLAQPGPLPVSFLR